VRILDGLAQPTAVSRRTFGRGTDNPIRLSLLALCSLAASAQAAPAVDLGRMNAAVHEQVTATVALKLRNADHLPRAPAGDAAAEPACARAQVPDRTSRQQAAKAGCNRAVRVTSSL
jgi:hypothetical protein